MSKRICKSCDIEKDVTEFNNSGGVENGHVWCRGCDNKASRTRKRRFCTIMKPNGSIEDWVIQQKTNLAPFLEKGGKIVHSWVQPFPENYDEWPRRGELLQGVLQKIDLEAGEKMGPVVTPKHKDGGITVKKAGGPTQRRKVRDFEFVVRKPGFESNSAAVSSDLRHNAIFDHGVCEFTGEAPELCDECHILARNYSMLTRNYEQITDENNVIFAHVAINRAMATGGHYLGMDGKLHVRDGYEKFHTLKLMGAYDTAIEMTPGRIEYAYLAMVELGVI